MHTWHDQLIHVTLYNYVGHCVLILFVPLYPLPLSDAIYRAQHYHMTDLTVLAMGQKDEFSKFVRHKISFCIS